MNIINRIIQVYRVRTPHTSSINNGSTMGKAGKRESGKAEKRKNSGCDPSHIGLAVDLRR